MAFKNCPFKTGLPKNILKPEKKSYHKSGKQKCGPACARTYGIFYGSFFVLGDSGKAGMVNAKKSACNLLPHKVAINAT